MAKTSIPIIPNDHQNPFDFDDDAVQEILIKISELNDHIKKLDIPFFESEIQNIHLMKLYLLYFKMTSLGKKKLINIKELEQKLPKKYFPYLGSLINITKESLIDFNKKPSLLNKNFLSMMRLSCIFLSKFSDATVNSLTKNSNTILSCIKLDPLLGYYQKYYPFFTTTTEYLTDVTTTLYTGIDEHESHEEKKAFDYIEACHGKIKQLFQEIDHTGNKNALYIENPLMKHMLAVSLLDTFQNPQCVALKTELYKDKIEEIISFLKASSTGKVQPAKSSTKLAGPMIFFREPKPEPLNDDTFDSEDFFAFN